MSLTDQPYLPLYVDDWMNNIKLKMCSMKAHGLMINIMGLMHKSDQYGKVLLNQKYKQTDEQIKNHAYQLAKLTSFEFGEILLVLEELINEKVIYFEGDFLCCERMIKAGRLSKIRAGFGKKGGNANKNNNLAYAITEANTEAKIKANTGIGIGIENGIENESLKGGLGEKFTNNHVPEIERRLFKNFYDQYPGTKREFFIEWNHFSNSIQNFTEVIPELLPGLSKEIEWRKKSEQAGNFVRSWKDLKNWISDQCYRQKLGEIQTKQTGISASQKVSNDSTTITQRLREKELAKTESNA